MRATQILTLGLFGAASFAASAGELGPTSRASVSISIRVPPHVMIKAAGADLSPASPLCVTSNGFHHYHLALLDADGAPRNPVPTAWSNAAMSGAEGGCGSFGTELVPGGSVPENAAGAQTPVTLLIVPD